MKFLKFLGARRFGSRAAERRFEILKFLSARSFGLHKQAAEFLKFVSELPRNRSKILKFTPKLRNEFRILKFMRASARLADTAQNFIPQCEFKILKLICELPSTLRRVLPSADIAEAGRAARLTSQHTHDATEKRHAVKINHAGGYLNSVCSVRRRIVRLRSVAARHGYKVGRAEKFSKFSLTNAFLNFISLLPRKFEPALLKFSPAPSRNGFEILKFTPELRKFKPASAVRLNFALNSVPPVRAVKFENGVKFRAAAKFKRGAR